MKITESQLREIIKSALLETIEEKAKSKAQQRFMGMVHAVQKGELDADEVGSSVAKAAKTMKKKDVKDFAETKHKGLPNHVDESVNREMEEKIRKTVREMIKSGELPKYYGKSKEPIEMAEYTTKILDKSLDKKSPDVVDKDFSICSSVVDDEFRKQGGKQDLDGVKNHEDSVKRGLKKIVKESIKKVLNERNNRPFYDYAEAYMKKNGKKLPDEELKNAEKKNNERFFNRKSVDGKHQYKSQGKNYEKQIHDKKWSKPKAMTL